MGLLRLALVILAMWACHDASAATAGLGLIHHATAAQVQLTKSRGGTVAIDGVDTGVRFWGDVVYITSTGHVVFSDSTWQYAWDRSAKRIQARIRGQVIDLGDPGSVVVGASIYDWDADRRTWRVLWSSKARDVTVRVIGASRDRIDVLESRGDPKTLEEHPLAVVSIAGGARPRRVAVPADMRIAGTLWSFPDAVRDDELLVTRPSNDETVLSPIGVFHLDTGAFQQLDRQSFGIAEVRWRTPAMRDDGADVISGMQMYIVDEHTHKVGKVIGTGW